MKKLLILTAAFLFAIQITKAQTEKGDQTLGINLGLTDSKNNQFNINYDGTTSTQNITNYIFNVGPNYSYFIADKLDAGAALIFNRNTSYYNGSNPDVTYEDIRSTGAEIYIRKYFMYNDKIGLRTGPYAEYTRGSEQQNYAGSGYIYDLNSKSNNYDAGVNLELVYYPAKTLGISASIANLSYNHSDVNNTTQGRENTDNVNFDFINNGLSLSVFYVFGNK